MKKSLKGIVIVLVAVLLLQSTGSGTSASVGLRVSTAIAGSSVLLSDFYAANENAAEKLASRLPQLEPETEPVTEPETEEPETEEPTTEEPETEEPTTMPEDDISDLVDFEEPRNAVVKAASSLNIRKESFTSSEVVGQAFRGEELKAIGEIKVGQTSWYWVIYKGMKGFVSGDYLAFGDEATRVKQQVEAERLAALDPLAMPTSFTIPDNIAGRAFEQTLKKAVGDLNYSLRVDYPNAKDSGNYTVMYSVLVYIMEQYDKVVKIAEANGLTATLNAANQGIFVVNTRREYLTNTTGKDASDFFAEIAAAQAAKEEEAAARARAEAEAKAQAQAEAERQAAEAAAAASAAEDEEERERLAQEAEEAARLAAEAEEAARRAAEEQAAAEAAARAAHEAAIAEVIRQASQECAGTIGRQMADYAATFVGILPYVWGGASLVSGADCSGFVAQILAKYGFLDQRLANIHGYCSGDFRTLGREVSLADIRPGDIVCYPGHVAMYFGGNIIVHEPNKNKKAEYGNVNVLQILTIRRFTPD